jgi:hypothetical protein
MSSETANGEAETGSRLAKRAVDEMLTSGGEVELRLATARARLRPSVRTRSYAGSLARVIAFWLVPTMLVLAFAYVFAARA